MDVPKVPPRSASSELAELLDSPEIAELVRELGQARWTGRPGYPEVVPFVVELRDGGPGVIS